MLVEYLHLQQLFYSFKKKEEKKTNKKQNPASPEKSKHSLILSP